MNDSHSDNSSLPSNDGLNWDPASPVGPTSVDTGETDTSKSSASKQPITRVSIPNIGGSDSGHQPWKGPKTADALAAETERRLNMLSQAAASDGYDILGKDTSSLIPGSSFDRLPNLGDAAFATPSSIADLNSIDNPDVVDSAPTATSSFTSSVETDELEAVVDSILDRFPIQQPVGLIFTGSESNLEVDRVAAEISDRLVKRRIGKVLLIDSHAENRELSRSAGGVNESGLTDSLLGQSAWQASVQSTSATGLEFLPFGKMPIESTFTDQYRGLLQEFKQYFQFVCVSAGSADSKAVAEWGQVADGGYLIVNLQCADQGKVKQAADRLKDQNLQVLGCIATDAN